MCVKPLDRDLTRYKPVVLLLGMLIGISSCSSTQAPTSAETGSENSSPSAATVTTTPGSIAEQIPELVRTDLLKQEQLINEINRDGEPLDFSGYRERAPSAVAPEGEDVVELNYEQADLRLVLEELGDALDISIVIDPSIDDKVSVRTSANRPLSRDDIWPLIRLLTRNAGITVEDLGDFYGAYKVTSGLPVEIITPETLGDSLGTTVMQVTPLVYVSMDSAIEVLGPMLEEGAIIKLTNRNVLAISGTASQLNRVNQLLTLIDADPFANQGIQLYQLNNASAEEVANELIEILNLIEGSAPSYQVKGIERINSILVTAPSRRGFEEISRWIQILDAENQEQVEQLFHYQVKNLKAVDLAATLTDVFDIDNDNEDGVPRLQGERSATATATEESTSDGNVAGLENQTIAITTAVSANLSVRIVADEATNSLLIRGTARDYRQLLTTISQLDSVPLQVLVNAVIAQVTLNESTKFGVDWSRVAANGNVDDISTSTMTDFLPGDLGGLMFSKTFVDGAARVDATLEAIAANNEVTLLARPSLTVINNQEGEIKIGANIPVEQGESIGAGGFATTNIQYRDTGITLTLTPQINSDGIVNLTISQILNSVDNSTGVNDNPIFNNQEITTTVVVRDAENVVLGGLIQSENELLNTGVPGLNRVPILGKLFSYQQDLQERKELFIVLRPEIINLNVPASAQYTDILQRFELAAELFNEAGI